ncbi:MAG TPA: hypothetical protein VJ810_04550 [Blastocatellia bacterium]|nr:hypothetical protein [Blastocatellia bacterium]
MHAYIKIALLISAMLALPNYARADTLTKLLEVKHGEIFKLSIAGLDFGRSGLFVIAVSDVEGNLRVHVWANDETIPRSTKTAGAIKEVATAALSEKRFVTAVRDSNDQLRVIAWQASENGREVKRLGTSVGPKISKLAAATGAAGTVFITARRSDGRLFVSYFEVVGASVNPKGSETYDGEVGAVAASSGTTNIAAMRDGEGNLRLIHFWNPLFRGGIGAGHEISDVRIGNNGDGFSGEWFTFSIDKGPTGVRTGAGCTHRRLIGHGLGKLIGWKLENTSLQTNLVRTREKQLTDFGGIAKKADLMFLDATSPLRLVTAHLGFDNFCRLLPQDQGKPRLQLTVWDTSARNDEFVKTADAHLGGDYTEIGITEIAALGNQPRFAVALRGVRGELKVTVWGVTP